FAPSSASIASDHNSQQQPVSTAVSSAIWALNANASALTRSTSVFGQINSTGLALGQNLGPWSVDLLGDYGLNKIASQGLLPGAFDPTLKALRAFILKNLPPTWNVGDGAVPDASSDIRRLPGFTGSVATTSLTNVIHTDETHQSGPI